MNIALCLSFLFALVLSVCAQKLGKCNDERTAAYDRCVCDLFITGDPNNTFPDSLESTTKWCRDAKKYIKCMKAFSNECLNSLPKQVNNVITYGMNKQVKRVCKTRTSRTEFSENIKCMNSILPKMNQIMYTYVDETQRVYNMETRELIPAMCCVFYKYQRDSKLASETSCPESEVTYYANFVANYAGDALDLLCGPTNRDSDTCKNLALPDKSPNVKSTLSPIPGMLLALERL